MHRRTKNYSHGMRQRLAIAQAMLGLPELLVLDEPTDGLDPPQIAEMRRVLKRYATDGRAVLVSSHLLAEVEQTCTHAVVVNKGRIVAYGPGRRHRRRVAVGAARGVRRAGGVERCSTGLGVRSVTPDGANGLIVDMNGTPRTRGGGRAGPGRRRAWTGWCPGAAWRTRSWPWWATTRGGSGDR